MRPLDFGVPCPDPTAAPRAPPRPNQVRRAHSAARVGAIERPAAMAHDRRGELHDLGPGDDRCAADRLRDRLAAAGRLNVSGAMFFTTAGLLVGPVLGLLDLQVHGEQVKLLAEVTLTLVLFADASRISLRASAMSTRCRCACSASACRSRSSPGADRGGGRARHQLRGGARARDRARVHRRRARPGGRLRRARPVPDPQGLNVESGLNDGLCVPLFFIAIAFAETDSGTVSDHTAAELVFEADRLRARRRRRRRSLGALALASPRAGG